MKCQKCGKKFGYELQGVNAPGCKDREELYCPYCGELCHSEMTPLVFVTYKLDEKDK